MNKMSESANNFFEKVHGYFFLPVLSGVGVIYRFIKASFQEMVKKVTWASYKELEILFIQFLIGLFICTLIVALISVSCEKILRYIIN